MPKLFGWLPKRRWLRWLILLLGGGFLLLVTLAVTAYFLLQQPAVQSWLMTMMFTHQLGQPLPDPPRPGLSAEQEALLARNAATLTAPGQLFAATNVWDVRFRFSSNEWAALGPNRIPAIGFNSKDGRVLLLNPDASRPGLAGVLGIDFPWSKGTIEFGDTVFTNTAIRFKGNGTFLSAVGNYKRPLKIDLNEHEKDYSLARRTKLNFANLLAENSRLTDTLGYEFYREAGVPTIRTAFARVLLTIEGRFDEGLLGLYLLVEDPDKRWAREAFGAKDVAVFKPVTYELFRFLGDDWQAYEAIYNAKTDVSPAQSQRVIDLARLYTQADDTEFAKRLGDYLDIEKTATWLACETLLANYDGIFTTGQNFLLYLDPGTDRFSFGPWDLDHSWGEFPFIGTADQREHASIWQPWTGENRFLERLFAHETFRTLYQKELERLLDTQFQPERLSRRLDELANAIRPFVAEESTNHLARFEACVASTWTDGPREGNPMDPDRPPYPLKRFFSARAQSVRAQLDGKENGIRLNGLGKP